jgi:hypothetical protein
MTLDQELRAVLAERAEAWETPPDFEAFIAGGRARQHRHRRVVLSASAVAVAGALAFSLVVGRGLWDTRSAPNPADQPTSPTQEPTAAPTPDDLIGIIGPPPPGTPPTGPATGQLVAAVALYNRVTWVYADGRIINVERHGISDESNGYWVRQLAPLGVEAMRSFLLDGTSGLTTRPRPGWALRVRDGGRLMFAREFDDCRVGTQYEEYCPRFTNPEDWLPPSAWEDPTFRAFVPQPRMRIDPRSTLLGARQLRRQRAGRHHRPGRP